MEKPKWLVSPCEVCAHEADHCGYNNCNRYYEWFVYSWEHLCSTLRKKWGFYDERKDGE